MNEWMNEYETAAMSFVDDIKARAVKLTISGQRCTQKILRAIWTNNLSDG